jgi:hypothetical protein
VKSIVFVGALLVSVVGLAVALRFLYTAWSDVRLGRNRRIERDRRHEDLPVPMERRRRQRRQ